MDNCKGPTTTMSYMFWCMYAKDRLPWAYYLHPSTYLEMASLDMLHSEYIHENMTLYELLHNPTQKAWEMQEQLHETYKQEHADELVKLCATPMAALCFMTRDELYHHKENHPYWLARERRMITFEQLLEQLATYRGSPAYYIAANNGVEDLTSSTPLGNI